MSGRSVYGQEEKREVRAPIKVEMPGEVFEEGFALFSSGDVFHDPSQSVDHDELCWDRR